MVISALWGSPLGGNHAPGEGRSRCSSPRLGLGAQRRCGAQSPGKMGWTGPDGDPAAKLELAAGGGPQWGAGSGSDRGRPLTRLRKGRLTASADFPGTEQKTGGVMSSDRVVGAEVECEPGFSGLVLRNLLGITDPEERETRAVLAGECLPLGTSGTNFQRH